MELRFTRIRLQDGSNTPIQVGKLAHVFLNCAGAGVVIPADFGARVLLCSNFRCVTQGAGMFLPVPSTLTDWGILVSPQAVAPNEEIQAIGVVVADPRKGHRSERRPSKEYLIIPEGTRIGTLLWF